jgi:hypothetical protein
VPFLTALLIVTGSYIAWLVLKVVLAPLARMWRERPVVVYDDRQQRWRAAPRLGTKR